LNQLIISIGRSLCLSPFFISSIVIGLIAPICRGDSAPVPPLPLIPEKHFNINDYGAVSDGTTLNTDSITKAIAASTAAGGGSVIVPAGHYLTGPFLLANNLNLHLEKDAVLLISDDEKAFTSHNHRYEDCISAENLHDVAITGEGTIDGQGQKWWDKFLKVKGTDGEAKQKHRPYLVSLAKCNAVRVQGITLQNSPMFHLVPKDCTDVTIDGVHFVAPSDSPNTDALDPSGRNFLITNCVFDVGDDCIAVKATGKPEPGHLSCEDFLITKCTFNHGHGMSIGGQTNGGLRRLTVRDCTFDSTDAGIRMKAGRGDGGVVEDLLYENLKMDKVKSPIVITSFYPKKIDDPANDPAQKLDEKTPIWRHIKINNVTSTNSPSAGMILGLAESPVEDVVLTNVHITAEKGLQIVHARGIQFVDSSINVQNAPAIDASDAQVTGLDPGAGH
jgi:polygalacturonase